MRDKASQPGFPQDDEFSLMQGCGGCANLDFWYDSQFVQNETTNQCRDSLRSTYLLEHTPVLPGTSTYTVYVGNTAVQIGAASMDGKMNFDKIGNPEFYVEGGDINHTTGEVTVRWNKIPPANFLVMSYEYNLETQWSDQ